MVPQLEPELERARAGVGDGVQAGVAPCATARVRAGARAGAGTRAGFGAQVEFGAEAKTGFGAGEKAVFGAGAGTAEAEGFSAHFPGKTPSI